MTIQGFERTLRFAHAEVLVDDLAVLQKFCAADARERNQQVAKALQLIEFLPARGTFSEFLQATENAFARLDWKQHWMEVASRSRDWAGKVEGNFSRTLYLRWLEEIASSFGVERHPTGDHPYARVHLLSVAQAQGQEWSHLIFAGFNEGSWPPAEKGDDRDGIVDDRSRCLKLTRAPCRLIEPHASFKKRAANHDSRPGLPWPGSEQNHVLIQRRAPADNNIPRITRHADTSNPAACSDVGAH